MSARSQAQQAYNRYKQTQKKQKKKKVVTTQTPQQEKVNRQVTNRKETPKATGNYSSFRGSTYYNPGRTSEGSVQTTAAKRYNQQEQPLRRNQQELQRQKREHSSTNTGGYRMNQTGQERMKNLTVGAAQQYLGSQRKAISGFMSGVTGNRAKANSYGGVQAHRNNTQDYTTRRDDRLTSEQLKTKETGIQKSRTTSKALAEAQDIYTKKESRAASKQIAKGTEKIEKGKKGLGAVGRFGADVYTGGLQLGMDMLAGGAVGGLSRLSRGARVATEASKGGAALLPMGVRAFGGAVDEAEQAGASWKKQMLYGAATTGIELGTERMFNVGGALRGAYGAGVGDKLVEKLTKKVGKSALKSGFSEIGAATVTEAIEEMVAEGLEPMVANAIYANAIGGDAVQDSLLNNPKQAGLNILRAGAIGGALGAPLGGAGVVMQNYQGKKISENAQNIYGEDGIKEMARQARESEDEEDAAFAQAVYNAINEGKGVANIQVARLQGVLNSQKKRDAERTVDAYNAAEKEIANNKYSTPRQAANAKATESVEVARRAIAENIPADVEMSEAETDRIITTAARIGSGIAGESDIREALSSAESITVMEAVTGLDLGGKSKSEQHDALIKYAAQQYIDAAERQTQYDNSSLKNTYKTIKEKDLGVGGQSAFDKIFEDTDVRGIASENQTDFRMDDIHAASNMMYTFEKFYEAGSAGLSLDEIRKTENPVFASLTPQQQEEAYAAGRNDALAEQSAAYLKDVQVGRKSKKAGTKVRPGKVSLARLNDENKEIMSQHRPLFEALAKALGIEIEFRDEITNVNGEDIAEGVNGHYQDGKITISMDNDKADMSKVPLAAIAYVFEHEVTHHMKVFAPAEFFRFKQFVKNKMMSMPSSSGNFANRYEEEIAKKRRQYGNEDVDLLFEEILADASIEFIQDEEFCKEICEQDADTAHAIVKALRNLMDKIREIMANIVLTDSQRQTLFSELDILKEAEQMWLDGIRVAAERRNAVGTADDVTVMSRKNADKDKDIQRIKTQLRDAENILNNMEPVATIDAINVKGMSDERLVRTIMQELDKSGRGVDREGFGFIDMQEKVVRKAVTNYEKDIEEKAVLRAVPKVLKRGKQIGVDENHKGNDFNTVTFGAPVIIKGNEKGDENYETRGNVAVLVKKTKGYRYKAHRILLPDGTAFAFNEKTEVSIASMTDESAGEGLAVTPVSKRSINEPENKVKKSMKDLVTLSEQRIDNLIDEYAIPGNTTSDYSKAWITSINPRDFLKLTISDEELEKWTPGSTNMWGQEVRELEPEDLKAKGKYDPLMPFLKVNSSRSHSVVSHEGRHRMLALLRAGYEDVPVVIYDTSESAKSNRQHEELFDLWSQDHGDGPVNSTRRDEEGELGYTVDVYDLIPINEKNRAEIERMYGGDTEVQFSRKYTPEEQQEHMLLGECREFYGAATTEDYKESGYIFPDGKMPKMGDGGIRGEDHIMAGTAYDDLWGSSAQNQFISEWNIRFTPEILGFEMSQEPTEEQYDRIGKIIDDVYADPTLNMVADGIRIDFTDEDGRVLDIQVFNGTSAEGIIGSIKAHFAGGTVTPMRQFLSRKDSEGRYLSEGQMEYFKDSKGRDAYGHLIPVYHSSDEEFTEFDWDKRGDATGAANTPYGFFTSPNEEFSKKFGKNTKKMYANITNPIIHPVDCHLKYPGREDEIVRTWFETVDPYQIPFLEEIVENGDYDNIYDAYIGAFMWEAFDYADDERGAIEAAGYDGIEIIEGTDYSLLTGGEEVNPVSSFVVFYSSQLKDVDNLDPTRHPDILMSRRARPGVKLTALDRKYFDALDREDYDEAQRMVDGAAEKAGYVQAAAHGTNYEFNEFDTVSPTEFGAHFGTEEAARQIINGKLMGDDDAQIYNVFLDLGNTIEMPDIFGEAESLHDYITQVNEFPEGPNPYEEWDKHNNMWDQERGFDGIFNTSEELPENDDFQEMREVIKEAEEKNVLSVQDQMYLSELSQKYMKGLGYDSVTYTNNAEDVGSTSYIIFDPSRIKSSAVATFDDDGYIIPLSQRFNLNSDDIRYSRRESDMVPDENYLKDLGSEVKFSRVTKDTTWRSSDGSREIPNVLQFLNDQEEAGDVVEVYRAMVMIDGKLYPPMATKWDNEKKGGRRKLQDPNELSQWIQSDERPELITDFNEDGVGYFNLNKDNGDQVSGVAYNPYIHTSLSPLNDQFTSAYKRPNLVIVKGIVPKSELTDGYHAQYAKDAVGETEWHSGPVAGQLPSVRKVILSRWFKPTEILTDAEVADVITDTIKGAGATVPYNVVTPGLRAEFERRGVHIGEGSGNVPKRIPPLDPKYKLKSELNEMGVDLTDGGSAVMFSRKSWAATDKTKLKKRLLDLKDASGESVYTEEEIDAWIEDIDSIATIIGEDAARLDYIAAEQHSFKKPDGDYYKYTLDSSTLCAKRLLYQGTYDAIMHVLKDVPLMENDVIRIRQMMAERMHEVPCGICYVESQRKTLGRYASEWLKGYKGEYVPSLDEVVSTDGLEWLRTEHPQTYDDFTKAMAAKGVSSPKVVQLRTDYREDLVRMTAATVEYLNKIGGLRWNSFSDFETPHLIDFMQATLDMSAKGLMGMAYTKVPNLVKVFGGTGVKFNLSLIPKVDENGNVEHDADGHIVFDDVEGMSIEDAMELRDKYPDNVATILVAKDKAHMLEAMNDDRVDFIIPFHRSKWTMAEFEKLGLRGYEDFATGDQENPIFPSEYWDYSISQKKGGGRKNAETYLKLCAERGEKPAFSKLLVDNGDGSYSLPKGNSKEATTIRNGYYKLIIEGKMFNHKTGKGAPQQKVKMNIDMDAAREVLAEYDGEPNALPVAEDVVRDFVKEKTGREVEGSLKFSRKVSNRTDTSPLDEEYLAAVKRGDMETAQRMVNEAAARAGYVVRAYHGTSSYGFTEFRKGVSLNGYARNRNVFGYGHYFSDVRDVAEHYAKKGRYIDKETGEIVEFTPGVYDVFLNLGNTMSIDWQSEIRPIGTQAEFDAYMDEKWNGRDSISVRNVNDGVPITSTVYVVRNPEK